MLKHHSSCPNPSTELPVSEFPSMCEFVKWDIVVPPAVVKYTYKPQNTYPARPGRTLDCLLNLVAHTVMPSQPVCHMLASELETVKIGLASMLLMTMCGVNTLHNYVQGLKYTLRNKGMHRH